jgi:hypothetical protein
MSASKKVDPHRIQMQCDILRTKGWEKPNIVHNAVKKTFKARWEKKMIG